MSPRACCRHACDVPLCVISAAVRYCASFACAMVIFGCEYDLLI